MFQDGAQPEHTTVRSQPPNSIPSSDLLCLRGAQAPERLKGGSFFLPRQIVTRPSWRLSKATKPTETLRDLLSFPITASSALFRVVTGWGFSTFSTFLEELELLGLKGKCFGPNEYANALVAYLRIQIEIEIVDDAEDPRWTRGFVEAGHTACLWYDERSGVARIFVLGSLPLLEMTAAVYHELGHLAAGHPLACYGPSGTASGCKKVLPRKLARRVPAGNTVIMEREARLREDYAITAGALGSLCFEDELLGQLS